MSVRWTTKSLRLLADELTRQGHRVGRDTVSTARVRARLPGKGAVKAVPYGIYDLATDAGWVSVGCNADNAASARPASIDFRT